MAKLGRYKPKVTKEEVKALLPPGSCKQCVWFFRCHPKALQMQKCIKCSRCQSFKGALYICDNNGVPMIQPKLERWQKQYNKEFYVCPT